MRDTVTVSIEGLRLRGRCGVTAAERALGQTLEVDVHLRPAQVRATATDDLGDTVDYGRVAEVVREVVEGGEFRLLERLAGALAERLAAAFAPAWLQVSVAKLAPPVAVPAARARVTVERER